MDLSSRSALSEGPAPGLTPPPLRLLQPWPAASLRASAQAAAGAGRVARRGWGRRVLDLLLGQDTR